MASWGSRCPLCRPHGSSPRRRAGRTVVEVRVDVDRETIERGLWCDPCALPSVVRFDLVIRCPVHGWPTSRLARAALCTECGSRTRVVEDG